jgi:Carboxypeptidase regulatory-like domain
LIKGLIQKLKAFPTLFLLFGAISVCYGQFSSNVQGTVSDPNGAVIAGATVTLTNVATNETQVHKTNSSGVYRFDSLLPGDYTVTTEAKGFEKTTIDRHVSTEETAGVNFKLAIGSTTTVVTVKENSVGLNPDETRLQYTLEAKDLTEMPLPDRSTITALRTAPGVVGLIETTGSTNTNFPIGQSAPDARANGRPASSTLYLLDRVPITSTESPGQLNIVPNPDMLSEIALQTTSFSVENGSTSSLQVDLTSKSGQNQFHGDADFSYTSKPFEASPGFGAVTPFHRRYIMGSLGGPIIKNHTFFFGSFQNINNLSALAGIGTGFTPDFYNWANQIAAFDPREVKLFSYLPSNLSNPTITALGSDVYAPGSTRACNTAATFYMPCTLPVRLQGAFNQNPGVKGTQYNIRLDQTMRSDKDRLYGSYFRADQTSDYIDPRPALNALTPGTVWYIGAGYTHIFNQSLVNQMNFGLDRYFQGSTNNPDAVILPHETLICSGCSNGMQVGYGPQDSPNTFFYGSGAKEHFYGLRDYVSWEKGRHSFRFGFQYQWVDYWQDNATEASRPSENFSDIIEMLQGLADDTTLTSISGRTGQWVGQYYGGQENQFGAYVEDEWKITPRLLLSLGLRWDDYGNPTKYGFDAADYANTFLGAGASLSEQVSNSHVSLVNHPFNKAQDDYFLPRVSFSWAPMADQKMTLRGGAGLYQDATSLSTLTALLPQNSPVTLASTLRDEVENGSIYNLFGNWQPHSGISYNPALPPATGLYGTQGSTPPFGFDYPTFPITGVSSRGLSLGPGGVPYPGNISGIDPNLKPQSTVLWNLSVNQEFPKAIVFGLLYSGSHSYNLLQQSGSFNSPPGSGGNPTLWTDVGSINLLRNQLISNYNALIVTAQQRAGNFSWQGSYTWGHTLGEEHWVTPYITTGYYATSDLDVRNRFSFSGSYQVPGTGQRVVRALTHGWTASGVIIAQSGNPFTVFSNSSTIYANDGSSNDRPSIVPELTRFGGFTRKQYENGVFGQGCNSGFNGASTGCPFVDDPATVNPVTLQGNEPINAFLGPGYFDVDIALQKRTEVPFFGGRKATLILRAEGLNALNRLNLQGVSTVSTEGNTPFATSTVANNPRIIQVGARFEF